MARHDMGIMNHVHFLWIALNSSHVRPFVSDAPRKVLSNE